MSLRWGDFLDDFAALTTTDAAVHVELAVFALFSLLDWGFAKIASKALPFDSEFPTLGSLSSKCRGPRRKRSSPQSREGTGAHSFTNSLTH